MQRYWDAGNEVYYAGYYPDVVTKTTLYLPKGRYQVYQFLTDSLVELESTDSGMPIEIANHAGEILVAVPTGQPDDLIRMLQNHRQDNNEWINHEGEKAFGRHSSRKK
jgi:hypothetical protein